MPEGIEAENARAKTHLESLGSLTQGAQGVWRRKALKGPSKPPVSCAAQPTRSRNSIHQESRMSKHLDSLFRGIWLNGGHGNSMVNESATGLLKLWTTCQKPRTATLQSRNPLAPRPRSRESSPALRLKDDLELKRDWTTKGVRGTDLLDGAMLRM